MPGFVAPDDFEDTNAMPSLRMLSAIGRLAILSASIEDILHALVWHYLEVQDDIGIIITKDKNMKRLCEDVKKLARQNSSVSKNMLDDIDDIITDLNATNMVRNHCVHWIWHDPNQDGIHKLEPPNYQLGKPDEYYKYQDVERVAEKLVIIEMRLLPHQMQIPKIYEQIKQGRLNPSFVPWLYIFPQPATSLP